VEFPYLVELPSWVESVAIKTPFSLIVLDLLITPLMPTNHSKLMGCANIFHLKHLLLLLLLLLLLSSSSHNFQTFYYLVHLN
jgi:hypothetical protein